MAEHPIACTLQNDDLQDRIVWIQGLFDRSLRERSQDDLTLHLVFAPEAAEEVTELVRRESACCPFLDFEQTTTNGAARLKITAPEDAREGVEFIFAPFNRSSSLVTAALAEVPQNRPGGAFATLLLGLSALTGTCNCAKQEAAATPGS